MDADSEILIDYLRSRALNATVRWASDHVGPDEPWATQWVDVRTIDTGAPPSSWAWTIVGPDDPDEADPDQLWCFSWPYDLDVYEVWKAPVPPIIFPSRIHEVAIPRGRPLPDHLDRAIRSAAGEPDCDLLVRGGWSVDAVTTALGDWTTRNAGRGDLRYLWDPGAEESETLQTVRARAASGGPFIDLGDGLVVHEDALEELQQLDPDAGAEIEKDVREELRKARGSADSGA